MKRNPNFLMRPVAGRFVLAPIGEMVKTFSGMITLNETGKFLWDMLEQDQTVQSMAQALAENYEVDVESAVGYVEKFLEPLLSVQAITE